MEQKQYRARQHDKAYTKIIHWSSADNLYIARVQEITGCSGHGNTEVEALIMLNDNLKEWLAFSSQGE